MHNSALPPISTIDAPQANPSKPPQPSQPDLAPKADIHKPSITRLILTAHHKYFFGGICACALVCIGIYKYLYARDSDTENADDEK